MNNLFGFVVLLIYGLLGGIPSIFMVIGIPFVIGKKIYRKIRYGIKLTD